MNDCLQCYGYVERIVHSDIRIATTGGSCAQCVRHPMAEICKVSTVGPRVVIMKNRLLALFVIGVVLQTGCVRSQQHITNSAQKLSPEMPKTGGDEANTSTVACAVDTPKKVENTSDGIKADPVYVFGNDVFWTYAPETGRVKLTKSDIQANGGIKVNGLGSISGHLLVT